MVKFCTGSPICKVCGASHREGVVQNCPSTLRKPTQGLGDKVESVLTSVGITKQRYRKFKKALGLKGDCGCNKRKEALNKLFPGK